MIPNTAITLPSADIINTWVQAGAREYNNGLDIPFHPTDRAPSTASELAQWAQCNEAGVDSLPVYFGGCDNTIYGSPKGNYLFRAWHDLIHIKEGLTFSVKDELKVSDMHCQVLRYLNAPYAVIKAIEADVKGQILYYAETGRYVGNQELFVEACLSDGIESVIQSKLEY